MKRDVAALLAEALDALRMSPRPLVEIEVPREESFGDLSTPLAMGLAKVLKKPPKKIAEDIVSRLKDSCILEKIEIAGPGFINVTFTKSYLYASLQQLLRAEKSYLRENIGDGKKVLIEFVSANPTGPLHIGHARGAAVGNALCNLLEESGFKVDREYYVNDAGRQVKLLGLSVYARYQQLLGSDMTFPEDGYRGQYIDDEAAALLAETGERYKGTPFDACDFDITSWTYKRMLVLIRKDLRRFDVKEFDSWVSEKEIFARGEVRGAIESLKQKGFIYEHDHALWFRSTGSRMTRTGSSSNVMGNIPILRQISPITKTSWTGGMTSS